MEDAKPANTKRATLIVVGIAAAGLLTFVLVAGIDELTKRNKEVEMSKAVDEANKIDAKATADAAKGLDVPTVEGEVKERDEVGEPAPTTTATSGSGGSGGETGDGGDGEEEKGVKGKLKKGREKVSVLVRNRNFQIAAAVVGIIVLAAIVVGVLYQLQILKFGEDQLIQSPPTPKHDSPGAGVDQTQNTYRHKMTAFVGGAGMGLALTGLIYALFSLRRWVVVGRMSFTNHIISKKEVKAMIRARGIIGLASFVTLFAVPLTLFLVYSSHNPMLWVPIFSLGFGVALVLTGVLGILERNKPFARIVFPSILAPDPIIPLHLACAGVLIVIGVGGIVASLFMAPVFPVVISGFQLL